MGGTFWTGYIKTILGLYGAFDLGVPCRSPLSVLDKGTVWIRFALIAKFASGKEVRAGQAKHGPDNPIRASARGGRQEQFEGQKRGRQTA